MEKPTSPAEIGDFSLRNLSRLPFFREFILFTSSTVIYFASRLVVSLTAARIVGPATWGLWNMLNLILVYAPIVHLGVINAMNRDVPLFKGKGELDKVDKVRRVALGFLLPSVFVSCICVAVAGLLAKDSIADLLLIVAILLFVTQIHTYLQLFLKSDKRFTQQSYQQLILAALLPAIVMPLALRWGLPGFIFGQSMALIVVSIVIIKTVPFNFKPAWDTQELRRLIKVGFPLLATGLFYILLTTVDRWVIANWLGIEQLGYYSLSILVLSSVTLIPIVIAQQVYPRMAETFGRTNSYRALKKWIFAQASAGFCITLLLIAGVYFLFPSLVRWLLPAFEPGIGAMKITLIGLPFLAVGSAFGNFLNTVDKQVYCMLVQGSAVLINVTLNIIFVKMGMGIEGVALGTALAYIAYILGLAAIGTMIVKRGLEAQSEENRQ